MANNTTNGDSNRKVFDLMNLLTQEEDPFFEPASTAIADKPVRKREEPEAEDYGSISADPRSFIQRKADEIYESGPAGAALAAIADILPGIPFVDIIDPPEQLSDPSSQTARNLLGAAGLVGGMSKTPQAVGRVATNIKAPWGYSPPTLLSDVKRLGIKESVKRFIKDQPLYDKPLEVWTLPDAGISSGAAREFLYRKMFGLKPRKGKNIFIEHDDGTLSFNPKSSRARRLMREIVIHGGSTIHPDKYHSVMGGYKRKAIDRIRNTGAQTTSIHGTGFKEVIDYEDIWDFKMNPGEWVSVFEKLKVSPKEGTLKLGTATLRSLVDMITKPPHIKGRLTMDKYGEFVGQKGPDPKVMKEFGKLMATD